MIGPLRSPPSMADPGQGVPASTVPPAGESTYAAAVLHLLADAVRHCATLDEARERLERSRISRRLFELAQSLQAPGGISASDCAPGPYELIVYSHMAGIIGRGQLARVFLHIARSEADAWRHPFWQEYSRGLEALMAGRPFEARELQCDCGLQQYWMVYLDLMEDIADGRDIGRAVESVDRAFKARNADAHISQDWFGIEGSARRPVRWDFRRDAILLARSAVRDHFVPISLSAER